jgi:hypothetical protein
MPFNMDRLVCVWVVGAMVAGILFGISACTSSPEGFESQTIEVGISTDVGIVGQDLDIVIYGKNFQGDARVVMVPDINIESRLLTSLELEDGENNRMAHHGDKVYYVGENNGFDVIDVQDPTTPQMVGHTDLPSLRYYRDMVVFRNVVYIAGYGGILMVDVSDPEKPQFLGRLVTQDNDFEYTVRVRFSGDIAFVLLNGGNADQDPPFDNATLYSLNVSDTANIRVFGSISLPNGGPQGFEIQDGLALYSYGDHPTGALIGIDISNPESLEITDSVETHNHSGQFCISNSMVFLMGGSEVFTIDISDPMNMKIVSQLSLPTVPSMHEKVILSGSSLFFFSAEVVWQLDVSVPTDVRLVGSIVTTRLEGAGNHQLLLENNNTAYLLKQKYIHDVTYFHVIDIGDMDDPGARFDGIAGAVYVRNATDLVLTQDRIYASLNNLGVAIIDVSDPEQPKRIDDRSISDAVTAMAASGHTLYTAYANSICIYNVEDPQQPILLSNFLLPDENAHLLEVVDDVLIACANTDESYYVDAKDIHYVFDNYLRTIDVSDPSNPTLMGSVSLPSHFSTDLIISNGTGYLSGYIKGYLPELYFESDRNCVVDLNDPFNPAVNATLTDGALVGQTTADDTLFMTAYDDDTEASWLMAIDVGDPSNGEEISRFSIPYGYIDSLNMNTVYFQSYHYNTEDHEYKLETYAVDASDPTDMRWIATAPPPLLSGISYVNDLIVDDGLAYLALGAEGVFVLPLPAEAENVNVESSSRISATLPGPKVPGAFTIKVIDESGNEDTEIICSLTLTAAHQFLGAAILIFEAENCPRSGANRKKLPLGAGHTSPCFFDWPIVRIIV